jgi:uncharacterized GH25 family protein
MKGLVMRLFPRLAASAVLLSLATPAFADRLWLLPSVTSVSGNTAWVTVDAGVSNDVFVADHALRLDTLKIVAPDGTAVQPETPATLHSRSVFDVKLDKPGTWKIGTTQAMVMGSFKVGDVEWRVGGRRGPAAPGGASQPVGATPPAGPGGGDARPAGFQPRPSVATIAEIPANATDIKLTEVIGQNNVFVTAGAPTTTVFQTTGKGLEMVPVTHPDELASNEPARFRFLADGKPAAGLKVTLVPGGARFRERDGAFEVTTGADGVAAITWPMAGMYWMNATITDTHPSEPRATERRMSYTATLEVVAP